MVGKLYKFRNGKEIEKSVQNDPFKTVTYSRRKRSPDFFDKVGQKVKELFEKAKRLFGIGQQQDGQGTQDDQEGRDGKFSYLFLWTRTVGKRRERLETICHYELLVTVTTAESGRCYYIPK